MTPGGKRIGTELVVGLLLVLVIFGVWWWQQRTADRRVEALRQESGQQLETARRDAAAWAEELAAAQARATFRGFAAGVAPLVLAGERQAVDQALGGLLELPAVAFVHVLDSEGGVIASSDRKLITTGQAGEAAAWALGSERLDTRQGNRPGLTELAAPVVGPAGASGYLWMGYDTGSLLERTRPRSLAPGSGAGDEPEIPEQELEEV